MSLIDNNISLAVVSYVCKSHGVKASSVKETIKSQMQHLMEKSLRTQFSDYNYFRQYGMGDIVVLAGTSTAGKTSIIKAMKQMELDRLEDGVDLRCLATYLKAMTKYSPNEIEILKRIMRDPLDIPKAVDAKERFWKIGVSSQEKLEAEEAIKTLKKTGEAFSSKEKEDINSLFKNMELEMFDDVFEHSRRGGNIIFDVINIDALAKHILMRKFDGPVRAVLTYCPFHVLSSRIGKRNKEAVERGELANQRIGEGPFMQFSEIYTKRAKGQRAFETLTRDQVIQAFNMNFDKGSEVDLEAARIGGRKPRSPKEILKEKEKLRAEFLKNLGFEEGVDVVEIAPKNQDFYHLFIDSNKLTPEESAKIIHRGTHQRYHRL